MTLSRKICVGECRNSKRPQVFIYAGKDIDQSVGQALEEELKQHGMDVIGRGARDPSRITKTEVFCYGEDVCNQSAQSVVNLLRGQGYEAEGPELNTRHTACQERSMPRYRHKEQYRPKGMKP